MPVRAADRVGCLPNVQVCDAAKRNALAIRLIKRQARKLFNGLFFVITEHHAHRDLASRTPKLAQVLAAQSDADIL